MLSDYRALPGAFDELLGATEKLRATVEGMVTSGSAEQFARTQALAEPALLNQGVTFSVYSDSARHREDLPLLPGAAHGLGAADWARLERGLVQRVRALEAFLDDVYGRAAHPEGAVHPGRPGARRRSSYLPAARAASGRPAGVRIHIAGHRPDPRSGRAPSACWRTTCARPSGVSYVLENRLISKRLLPDVLDAARVQPRRPLPGPAGRRAALGLAGRPRTRRSAVVLTPGPYNSAYFEHSFLARTMGARAGAGGRPLRRRRPGLRADHPRPAPGPRHLPAHRRRLPRPGGLPPRQPARACAA